MKTKPTLNDIDNVIVSNVIVDDVLTYDGTDWVNAPPASGGGLADRIVYTDTGTGYTSTLQIMDQGYLHGWFAGYDNVEVVRINNDQVFVGPNAGRLNSQYGYDNVAIGVNAGADNANGSNNTVVGNRAWYTGTGSSNVAVGYEAMQASIGSYNTAVGMGALYSSNGSNNTAIGSGALNNNSGGYDNVAVGYQAMRNNISSVYNTVIGNNALLSATSGSNNVVIGVNSAVNCDYSDSNTIIGGYAGTSLSTGGNNILIGYNAGTDAVAFITTESNRVVLGNDNTTNANIKVAWTVTSDERDKTDIIPVPHGLEFVSQLQPKQFKLKNRETQEATTGDRYGFIAQDVLPLEGNNPIVVNADDINNLKLNESMIVPVLVNAIKELLTRVEVLEQQLTQIAP